MNKILRSITLTSILVSLPILGLLGQDADPAFRNLLNSVVRIDVWERDINNGFEQINRSQGSGVIVSQEGYILTNAHVVNPNAQRIEVTLANKHRVPARFVGWDHWTDLAVIQLDAGVVAERGVTFSFANIVDSKGLTLGDALYAVGTPYGLNRTLTKGILSNAERYLEGYITPTGYESGDYNTWLQTDAAINPGNSGGPLVRPNGDVIGINTQVVRGTTLGFAIPSNVIIPVWGELLRNGEVTRSYIGVTLSPLQDVLEEGNITDQGALIANVDSGSPAYNVGLLPGDIITSINGEPVDGYFPEQIPVIMAKVARYPVESRLELVVQRGPESFVKEVVTERLESRVGAKELFPKWGLSIEKVSKAVARESKLVEKTGVRVLGMQPALPASNAGLRINDIILKANNVRLQELQDLKGLYAQYEAGEIRTVLFEVYRQGTIAYIVLQ